MIKLLSIMFISSYIKFFSCILFAASDSKVGDPKTPTENREAAGDISTILKSPACSSMEDILDKSNKKGGSMG